MKEQKDRPNSPWGSRPDLTPSEPAKPRTESELVNLFEENGLFDPHTPQGIDPTTYPMRVLGDLRYDVAMKAHRLSRQNTRQAHQLEAWAESVERVNMAYEVLAYPLLDEAERKHARNPLRDPHEHGPASHKTRINEGIRDAQEHPNRDLREFPHRGPITLNETEMQLLGRIAQGRAIPFDPEKRVFRYTDLLPRLQADDEAFRQSPRYRLIQENMIRSGLLRPRAEIEKEIAERQKRWKEPSPGQAPPPTKPPKR